MFAKAGVPVHEIANSVAKSIVIGDGGVDGGQSTVAHLPENLPRPVAKLQSVDSRGRFAGFLHAEISPDRRPSRPALTSNSRSALIRSSPDAPRPATPGWLKGDGSGRAYLDPG